MRSIKSKSLSRRLKRQRLKGQRKEKLKSLFKRAVKATTWGGLGVLLLFLLGAVKVDLWPRLQESVVQMKLLKVKKVHLVSSGVLPRHELLLQAGLKEGMNIWRTDASQVVQRLTQHPLVRRVSLQRKFPNEILLKVEERQAKALLFCRGKFYENADRDGTPYRRISSNKLTAHDLPVISLSDCPETRVQKELALEAFQLMELMQAEGLFPQHDMAELHFDTSEGWTFILDGQPRQIHWGDLTAGRKILRLKKVLSDLERRRLYEVVKIDLDFRNRVIVELPDPGTVEASAGVKKLNTT